jgi:hypothetical protein
MVSKHLIVDAGKFFDQALAHIYHDPYCDILINQSRKMATIL